MYNLVYFVLVGLSLKTKREINKLRKQFSIILNPTLFKMIRNEAEKYEELQTAGVYRIKASNIENKEITYYIRMTKRKINERFKEHIRDLKYNNKATALSKANIKIPLKPQSIKIEKIANYNLHNTLMREAVEISSKNENVCNDIAHSTIDSHWRIILDEKKKTKEKRGKL